MSHFQIDGIRMSPGGTRHEHISHIFGPAFGQKTRFDGVSDIFYKRNTFFTRVGLVIGDTPVERWAANHAVLSINDHLQTVANGRGTDNLLALPRK